ncbi:hypothetical protein PLICRDRAFT_170877 [Plicaturopsis crispa FD-325 SS-3]|nr:hypothetical protein PLICRDRAFT_170877 [Plicaturopsis crispa FD-325 SS-3]
MLSVIPFETSQRPLRTVSDQASYKKLHATLPAVVLAAQKVRVRNGDASAIRELWARKDKSFLAVSFEWSERNPNTCFEWGYAALRCGHLHALGVWPPDLDTNCRKGHYVVSEYADKVHNKHSPSHPWQYAFGESHAIPKAKLAVVIQAIISSLASPDSETHANDLVLVGHGLISDLQRLEEMKIKIPRNVLVVDTVTLEHNLFATGARGAMLDPRGHPRAPNTSLSLASLLHSLPLDVRCVLHNSGNDAFLTLFAMQRLIDPDHTPAAPKWGSGTPPDARPRLSSVPGHPSTARMSPQMAYPVSPLLTPLPSGQTGYFGLDVGEQRPRVPKQVSPGGDRNSRRLSAAPSKESDARSRRVSLM